MSEIQKMALAQKQRLLVKMVGQLIEHAHASGYEPIEHGGRQ